MSHKRNGHTYILEGNPTPSTHLDMDKKRIWDARINYYTNNQIALTNQHEDYDLFNGPLHLDATFYLVFPGSLYKSRGYQGKYHQTRPYLSTFIFFIETIGEDILFTIGSHIVSANVKKLYDSYKPRVEFKLTEISS